MNRARFVRDGSGCRHNIGASFAVVVVVVVPGILFRAAQLEKQGEQRKQGQIRRKRRGRISDRSVFFVLSGLKSGSVVGNLNEKVQVGTIYYSGVSVGKIHSPPPCTCQVSRKVPADCGGTILCWGGGPFPRKPQKGVLAIRRTGIRNKQTRHRRSSIVLL